MATKILFWNYKLSSINSWIIYCASSMRVRRLQGTLLVINMFRMAKNACYALIIFRITFCVVLFAHVPITPVRSFPSLHCNARSFKDTLSLYDHRESEFFTSISSRLRPLENCINCLLFSVFLNNIRILSSLNVIAVEFSVVSNIDGSSKSRQSW
jgi:hypothetical protein